MHRGKGNSSRSKSRHSAAVAQASRRAPIVVAVRAAVSRRAVNRGHRPPSRGIAAGSGITESAACTNENGHEEFVAIFILKVRFSMLVQLFTTLSGLSA